MTKYNLNESNFPWEKTASHFFCMIYNFTIAKTSQFAKCEAKI